MVCVRGGARGSEWGVGGHRWLTCVLVGEWVGGGGADAGVGENGGWRGVEGRWGGRRRGEACEWMEGGLAATFEWV